jgi:hypothetical protein
MRTTTSGHSTRRWTVACALVLLFGILIVPSPRHWVRAHVGNNKPLVMTFKPLVVGSGIGVGSPYPAADAWANFLPAPAACPGSTTEPSVEGNAVRSMVCALNYARAHDGLEALPVSPQQQQASRLKAGHHSLSGLLTHGVREGSARRCGRSGLSKGRLGREHSCRRGSAHARTCRRGRLAQLTTRPREPLSASVDRAGCRSRGRSDIPRREERRDLGFGIQRAPLSAIPRSRPSGGVDSRGAAASLSPQFAPD